MKKILTILMVAFASLTGYAQEEEKIDASKPTNFYTLMDNQVEFSPGSNQVGYRASIMYSPAEKHLFMGELPILYNTQTKAGGVGDVRFRYFYLSHKDYSKTIGAFGPSIDVFAPTGDAEKGLGTGRFIVSPGLTAGIMVADWIQFFPVLSYMYQSKKINGAPQVRESIPMPDDREMHGMSFQVITPIVFSERFFTMITPIYQLPDFRHGTTNVACEFLAQYKVSEKMQLSGFYKQDQRLGGTARIGLTFFL
ncbi:hypothetical protein [Persicobacter psychrovividus]|uniref:Transporter n=1 Tax=Persicobacter psychrovividus TaxID=387638 RepID=A0ABM7VMB6_9BACT|nr:hypothetical protein PEPS_44300 [Persicobacter psychrovividus]